MTTKHGLCPIVGRRSLRTHATPFALWSRVFDFAETVVVQNCPSQWGRLREATRSPLLNSATLCFDAFGSSGRRPRFRYGSKYPLLPISVIKPVQLMLKKSDRGGQATFTPTVLMKSQNLDGIKKLYIIKSWKLWSHMGLFCFLFFLHLQIKGSS